MLHKVVGDEGLEEQYIKLKKKKHYRYGTSEYLNVTYTNYTPRHTLL